MTEVLLFAPVTLPIISFFTHSRSSLSATFPEESSIWTMYLVQSLLNNFLYLQEKSWWQHWIYVCCVTYFLSEIVRFLLSPGIGGWMNFVTYENMLKGMGKSFWLKNIIQASALFIFQTESFSLLSFPIVLFIRATQRLSKTTMLISWKIAHMDRPTVLKLCVHSWPSNVQLSPT